MSERALLMTGFLFTAAACFVFVPFGQKLPPRGMARKSDVIRSDGSFIVVVAVTLVVDFNDV